MSETIEVDGKNQFKTLALLALETFFDHLTRQDDLSFITNLAVSD
jgi:hypothetical protein